MTPRSCSRTRKWGLELVLKAYLQTRGWDDERCSVLVRHDLAKALAACDQSGLLGVSDDHRAFVADFSPFARVHQVDAFVKPGAAG